MKNRLTQVVAASAARNGNGTKVPSVQVYTVADVPPLSEEDQAALADFEKSQQVLRDLTRGCINGHHTGAFIFGPPGVSKSFTILQTLREQKVDWRLHQRITAKPLYLELEKSPNAVHVIEDNPQLFNERSAPTLILSALGGEYVNGRRERRVCYSVTGSHARVMSHYFSGSIIFTSNRPLSDEKPEIQAVLSRIPAAHFAPTDREIKALMRHVARQGFAGNNGTISPLECVEIIEYIIGLAAELRCRLDLRWIHHGYGHYLTHATAGGTHDWRDMAKFHMMRTITYCDHASQDKQSVAGRRAAEADEVAIAQEIARMNGLSQDDRLRLWEQRTDRLSRATYYRRLAAGRD